MGSCMGRFGWICNGWYIGYSPLVGSVELGLAGGIQA
jgi:hypothetical protein